MKIWITYSSPFTLVCSGLAAVNVWFKRPVWTEPKYFSEDSHFWSEREVGAYAPNGWGVHEGNFQTSLPFNQLFGYGEGMPELIWEKLREHFGGNELRDWEKYAKENENCVSNKFIIELELKITLNGIKTGLETIGK